MGTIETVGFKSGRWLDSVLMQRPLGEGRRVRLMSVDDDERAVERAQHAIELVAAFDDEAGAEITRYTPGRRASRVSLDAVDRHSSAAEDREHRRGLVEIDG